MTNLLPSTLALSLGLLGTLGPDSAEAANAWSFDQSNAAGVCQPALPAYDGLIRKRPRSLQNEGTAPAFVTCAFPHNWTSESRVKQFQIYISNTSGMPKEITCTAVFGTEGQSDVPANSTKSLSVTERYAYLTWDAPDFGSELMMPRTAIGVSCQLPPQTGVDFSTIRFSHEIGI